MNAAQAYAIEVEGRSVGIVVADHGGFMFYSADGAFRSLERRLFSHVRNAEAAANQLAQKRISK